MSLPPDDLPRSPSGRVPRWVADEAAGRTPEGAAPGAWGGYAPAEPAPPAPRRRSLVTRLAVVAVLGLLAWWLATAVLPGLLRSADAPFLDGVVAGRVPEPTEEVAALAGEMFLTDEGRDLLYMAEPELLGAEEFAGRCDRGEPGATGAAGGAVGCYHSTAGGIETGGRIVIYTPADPRLRGFVVETAAHELLHAAWNELTDDEQTAATTALATVLDGIDPADDIHTQISGSVGTLPANRPTELFAYIGTQVWQPGGLDPALEAVYARFIANREALVAVHTAFQTQIDTMTAEVTAAQQALAQRQYDQSAGTAQLQADIANLAQYRGTIEQEEARLAALPESERARSLLSWTWRDGTALPEAPAAELLADARALLARDEAEIAARGAALQATAAEVAAEQTRVDTMRTELEALFAQLNPG
ncbi:hypothetical protein [Cellulomonas dongxiuzhuiae]|uniref:hypothetical protein n=1 Tax=Cellulomonas dongxiuzhuiae TaxID=2819979 RepID=UPI001AAFDFE7|nr:hypothetical protein [Cellulomonas dongxiuzhuiae]MBO3089442.1 hypothetical protein [Cellulomonas dongxiuzhuiae]